MKVQLVAIDIDGTLLNDDYQISPRTKKAIQKMQQQGVRIILASGRGPRSCDPYIEELQLADEAITHNGAVIYEKDTGKVHLEIGYEAQELLPIIDYCRKEKIHFDLSSAFEMYIEQEHPQAQQMYAQFFVNPTLVEDSGQLEKKIVKFTLFDIDKQRLDQVMQDIVPLFPDWTFIRSGETFIDVIHPQATKGNALCHLLQKYHIEPKEVVAFGNFYNDVEMIQLAGLGVAMDNSPQDVKDLADRVTASNHEDGVAVVLEELLSFTDTP